MKNIKFLAIPALLATLVSCVNGDDYGTPDLSEKCATLAVTKQVSQITGAATSNSPQLYADPRDAQGIQTEIGVIEAYVTSSDEGGNFYKSISLVSGTDDNAKGFTIPVDNYNLYTKYEPGRKVYIKLDSLYYNFRTQTASYEIGNLYNGNQIGRLSGVEFENVITRGCDDQKIDEELLVKHMTIAQAKNDANMHKLIEFDNVQFSDISVGKKYFDPTVNNIGGATNHIITDEDGNSIEVRVSEFVTFKNSSIPSGNGKIRGVLTKYNSGYQFMIRTLNDVTLDNPRQNPVVETFESYANNTATFPNYYNIKVIGTNDWFVGTFNGNKYLQARKGASTGATKIFFVMPYDFDTYTKLSFQTLYGYMSLTSTPIMKVYYSTNFDQTNPTANLVDITNSFTYSNYTGTSWASSFTNSGVHTFTGVTGQGHIIFAYDVATASTTNVETRPGIQLDNIKFQ
ncbi:DUF5689 domain-containing protein [Flavobacterium suncheonense]|uniref:DUF5689 domain-containing protein n=1 Tax=Flavobacterium suncheonense GH29-5 = DSM 17707 TaxID=1121899 RepID=A0A0A2M914_9FLAO|nr:DUF5689 domain-containing protein [Flavobacterium suncheonense]KGO89147.1 hypothetical protein Q764_08730 [Flavobacterium suncheonense GH29-5 = DSM 17707]